MPFRHLRPFGGQYQSIHRSSAKLETKFVASAMACLLLRWSGMALMDAVQYRPELVDADGVLRYRRQKTAELATVQLPDHVVSLLRNVPLEADSIGKGQPFRMRDFTPHSDTVTWRKRLMKLFVQAELKMYGLSLAKFARLIRTCSAIPSPFGTYGMEFRYIRWRGCSGTVTLRPHPRRTSLGLRNWKRRRSLK